MVDAVMSTIRVRPLALVISNALFQQPREDSTHGHHQTANTEIRLVIFFAAEDGEALYSHENKTGSSQWLG